MIFLKFTDCPANSTLGQVGIRASTAFEPLATQRGLYNLMPTKTY